MRHDILYIGLQGIGEGRLIVIQLTGSRTQPELWIPVCGAGCGPA